MTGVAGDRFGSPFDLRPRQETTDLRFRWVFPYAPVPVGRPLPALRVWLELPTVGLRAITLGLDTGADMTLIAGGWAELVGFDPTREATRIEPVRGVTGASVAFVHRLSCMLGPADDPLRLSLEVGFTDPAAPAPPISVLGRQGVLDHFAVAIENYLLPPCLYLAPRGYSTKTR
jgi:hypothetical protein